MNDQRFWRNSSKSDLRNVSGRFDDKVVLIQVVMIQVNSVEV